MLRFSITAAVAATIVVAAPAGAASIVYVKDGNVRLVDTATGVDRAITSSADWESPSQTDDGLIVAVRSVPSATAPSHRNRSLIRLTRTGEQIGGPGVPVRPDSSQNGPFDAKVSPDGRNVAFWKLQPTLSDYPVAAIAPTDDPTAYETENYWSLTGSWKPFWLSSTTAALFRQQNYPRVSTYTLGDQFSNPWFGNDETTPTQAGGDVTADGARMVTVVAGAQELRLYQLNGPPPAAPTPVCSITGPVGTFRSPTWAPGGGELAWADDDGIHRAQVRNWAACDIPDSLSIPGGDQPDWGAADGPAEAPAQGPAGTPTQGPVETPAEGPAAQSPGTVKILPPVVVKRSTARRKGIPVAVSCPRACKAVARVLVKRRVLGRVSRSVAAGTSRLLRVRAKVPAGVRRVRLKVAAGGVRRTFWVKIR